MTTQTNYVTLWTVIFTIVTAHGLECWKCIADNCGGDPDINYKAKRMTCGVDASCMKVRYQMFDNVTTYDSIIRTCSSGACVPVTVTDFKQCISDPRLYMVSGCSHRSCCNDKNLCNSADRSRQHFLCLSTIVFIVYISVMILS